MIVLQHYGLHTRLLDLTSNPLIALFFACNDEKEKEQDGKVFCYCSKGDETDFAPHLIASIIMKNTNHSDYYDNFIQQEFVNQTGHLCCSSHKFKSWEEELCKPHFFLSPLNNNRITAQRGTFIIAPLNTSDLDNMKFNYKKIENMNDWISKPAVVAAKAKQSLLEELALLGIDESTVFPDMEHLLQFLNTKHQLQTRHSINI